MSRTWAKAALGLGLLLLAAEYAYYAGARAAARDAVPVGESCAVFILGFPARKDGWPTRMQKLRVAAGVRAFKDFKCARMVISGGAPHSPHVEAKVMAALAVARGVPYEALRLEKTARTTWENVTFSLPQLKGFDHIVVVSDGLHVHRGRRYLCRRAPEMCSQVKRASSYRFGRLFWFKPAGLFHEAFAFVRDGVKHS